MRLKNKVRERCPCCGIRVYRDQCGRFMLPTRDGKTNHFLTCKPLRKEFEKRKRIIHISVNNVNPGELQGMHADIIIVDELANFK